MRDRQTDKRIYIMNEMVAHIDMHIDVKMSLYYVEGTHTMYTELVHSLELVGAPNQLISSKPWINPYINFNNKNNFCFQPVTFFLYVIRVNI